MEGTASDYRGIPQELTLDARTMSLFADVCELVRILETKPKASLEESEGTPWSPPRPRRQSRRTR